MNETEHQSARDTLQQRSDVALEPCVSELLRTNRALEKRNEQLADSLAALRATLCETDNRLATLSRATNDAVRDWNLATDELWWSDSFQTLFGYGSLEVEPGIESWIQRLHPLDADKVLKAVDSTIEGGGTLWSIEYRFLRAGGSYATVLERGFVFRNEQGQALRAVGSMLDITEQRLAERALQSAKDDLEIRVVERTQALSQVNRSLQAEVAEKQQAMGALREAAAALEQARDQTQGANKELRENEARLLEGNRIFADLTRIRVSGEEELRSALWQITEAGSFLLSSERCSVWLYNADETSIRCLNLFERASNRHSRDFELSVRDFPGYFSHLTTRRAIVAEDAHTHPATCEFSAVYLAPLGIASMLDVPIVIGGKMVGVLCCEHIGKARRWPVEDQTFANAAAALCSLALESFERTRAETALRHAIAESQRAREEAERADAAKSEFLSRMSHELRTPLNAILGFAQLLEMEPLDDEQSENVEQILRGGEHLLELINEVLDISRVESGRLELFLSPVSLQGATEEAFGLLRPLASAHGITLENQLTFGDEEWVLADAHRLKQVLLNLLANGVKYNRPGGFVRVRCPSSHNNFVRLEVQDCGHGIAPENVEKLFSPFERLDAERSGIEGTGLGLMLSRRLVEAMGGVLGVESTVGEGSTFFVQLARADVS